MWVKISGREKNLHLIKLFLPTEVLSSFTAQIYKFLPTLVTNPLEEFNKSSRGFHKSSSGFFKSSRGFTQIVKRILMKPAHVSPHSPAPITRFSIGFSHIHCKEFLNAHCTTSIFLPFPSFISQAMFMLADKRSLA